MIQAACSNCGASFNVGNKAPGASFKCPKCHAGTITVPSAAEPLEELTDAEEVPAETIELIEVEEIELVEMDEVPATNPARPVQSARPAHRGVASPGARPRPGAARPARTARAGADAGAADQKKSKTGLWIVVGAVVIAAAIGGYFAMKGGAKEPTDASGANPPQSVANAPDPNAGHQSSPPGNATPGTSAPVKPAAPPKALNPREEIAAKRAALAPDDVNGRLALAAEADKAGLRTERTMLLRDVTLLDPDNETARTAFGFKKYSGRAVPYQGRWLGPEDFALATKSEEWLDAVSNGSGGTSPSKGGSSPSPGATGSTPQKTEPSRPSSSSNDPEFPKKAAAMRAALQDKFPDDTFDYRYDDGIMPRPYFAAIQKIPGASVDDLEKTFGKALGELYKAYMAQYRELFDLDEITEPVPVMIFGSAAGYDAWQQRALPANERVDIMTVGGYFSPSEKRLMVWRQQGFLNTLFHEGTHELMFFATGGNFHSPWLQEGIAEFFGGFKITQTADVSGKLVDHYQLGQFLTGRYAVIQAAIGGNGAPSVKDLVNFGYPEFGAAQWGADKGTPKGLHWVDMVYAEGWSLIMYLQYGQNGKYHEGFNQYLKAESEGESSVEKFGEIMGLKTDGDWAAFDKDFKAWVMSDLPKMKK